MQHRKRQALEALRPEPFSTPKADAEHDTSLLTQKEGSSLADNSLPPESEEVVVKSYDSRNRGGE